jgi:hypothetical protein
MSGLLRSTAFGETPHDVEIPLDVNIIISRKTPLQNKTFRFDNYVGPGLRSHYLFRFSRYHGSDTLQTRFVQPATTAPSGKITFSGTKKTMISTQKVNLHTDF